MKKRNINYGLAIDNRVIKHNFDFKGCKVFLYIHNKKRRHNVESFILSNQNTIKQKTSSLNLSFYLVRLAIKRYKILTLLSLFIYT